MAMRKILKPDNIAAPGAAHHHGVLITAPTQFARLAGQIGMAPDGTFPDGIEAQAEQAWDNVEAILAEAGMGVADVCKVVTYVTDGHQAGYAAVHSRRTAGVAPPWTLVPVAKLGGGRFLVEVDVEAMK